MCKLVECINEYINEEDVKDSGIVSKIKPKRIYVTTSEQMMRVKLLVRAGGQDPDEVVKGIGEM